MAIIPRFDRRYAAAIIPLCFLPFLVGASIDEEHLDSAATRLSVIGIGYDTQPVTFLQISAGVESFSTDASDAMADNASKLDRLRRQLERNSVNQKDFQTSNLSLSPDTDNDGERSVKGFKVRHMITVILRKPAEAGPVLDALVQAGATNIGGPISYWQASPAAAARARTLAIKDAMTRAQVYAGALGMKVKRIVSINDSSGYATNQPRPDQAMARIDVATRVDAGQDNVTVSIGAVFELSKT